MYTIDFFSLLGVSFRENNTKSFFLKDPKVSLSCLIKTPFSNLVLHNLAFNNGEKKTGQKGNKYIFKTIRRIYFKTRKLPKQCS